MQDEEGFLLKPRCRAAEAAEEVPRTPGYYSIFIENPLSLPKTLSDRLLARDTRLIYVGLATTSLRKRLVDQDLHHQGPSTFFRTIGAVLGRLPEAGSLITALNQSNYKFNKADTDEITSWIPQNLWVNWRVCDPAHRDFEVKMIGKYRPIINTAHNPDAVSDLRQLRDTCRTVARNPRTENDKCSDRPSASPPSDGKATIEDSCRPKTTEIKIEEILLAVPGVLEELAREFIRRMNDEAAVDSETQVMAGLSLAIRSASLLCGMGKLLTPQTRDSFEVLTRGFLEARDLLMTFRFDHKGTKDKMIVYWFEGKADNSWKPDHKKCNKFWEDQGYPGMAFNTNWSKMTTVAHPTRYATQNSAICASLWAATPPRVESFHEMMEPKIADYLANVATLIVNATVDLPGLISLGCDPQRMPSIDSFRAKVLDVVVPILSKFRNDLPRGSYRED